MQAKYIPRNSRMTHLITIIHHFFAVLLVTRCEENSPLQWRRFLKLKSLPSASFNPLLQQTGRKGGEYSPQEVTCPQPKHTCVHAATSRFCVSVTRITLPTTMISSSGQQHPAPPHLGHLGSHENIVTLRGEGCWASERQPKPNAKAQRSAYLPQTMHNTLQRMKHWHEWFGMAHGVILQLRSMQDGADVRI